MEPPSDTHQIVTNTFTLTIHMVSSLDGFIAKKDNSVSWFETDDHYEKGVEITKQETEQFIRSIDCYVMGTHTYEHALALSKTYGWPYGDVPTIVVTHRDLPVERRNIELYSGNLEELVNKLKANYKNVWLVGGAMLAENFIRLRLADEISVSVLPIILGEGLTFLDHVGQEQALHLKDATAYKNGMVQLWYEIRKQ